MSIPPPFRRGLIACVLLSAALSSLALTLGRSRGAALIGRPLDVAIALSLDNAAQVSDLCPEADVFHGDTRVNSDRVSVRVEPGSGLNAVLRVQSAQAVDEPVVTIYLRLGCKERFTRRYVLLADEPGEVPLSASGVTAAPVPLAVPPVPAPAPAPAPARAAPRAAAPAAPSPRTSAVTAPAPQPRTRTAAPVPRAPTRAVTRSGKPRLTVEMVELGPERDPQLRATAGLAGLPSTDEQVRAQAAALWRSINAQPEDVLRDLQRVQALENDVKGLRGLVTTNDRTLNELRGQLDQARQERTLTLAAIALLALLLAAFVVTWFLRRGERPGGGEWWRRREAAGADAPSPAPGGPVAPASQPLRAADMDLRVDESMFESLKKPARPVATAPVPLRPQAPTPTAAPPMAATAPVPLQAAAPAERSSGSVSGFSSSFQHSSLASMRMVKAEELVDIQQQADFFMSLGQTDQAIEVLESHIHHNAETSALVWLDLLAIYRATKQRAEYEGLRAEFQRTFNAEVPAYDASPTVSGGLEDYPRALTRIAALWPSPKVMDVIEESIFRKPGTDGAEPFDLEAYRELVMLYNVGREVVMSDVIAPGDDGEDGSGFNETSMQPLSGVRRGAPALEQDSMLSGMDGVPDSTPGHTNLGEMVDFDSMLLDDSDAGPSISPHTTGLEFTADPQVPRPSPRLGLDIDLTTPAEPPRKAPPDSNMIDFELSEPDLDTDSRPDKPQ